MPRIAVDAKTTFNPALDSDKIGAFYTCLATTTQVRHADSAEDREFNNDCAYFTQAETFACNGIEFDVRQSFFCEKNRDTGAYRCFFVGSELGKGAYATVCALDAVVEATPTSYLPSGGYAQPKAIRVQQHCACAAACLCAPRTSMTMLKNEYSPSKKVPHLAMELPRIVVIQDTTTSYTVMNQFFGRELHSIIADDLDEEKILTLEQRMQLTLALYKALKHQVSDLEIIHRDLKPDNIIVNLTGAIGVNFIDYGFAEILNRGEKKREVFCLCGTETYVAPEGIKNPVVISVATDLYSLSRILLLLWGGLDNSFDGDLPEHRIFMAKEDKVEFLFRTIPQGQREDLLRLGLNNDIKRLLARGLTTDQDQRGTVDEAIRTFEEIYLKYTRSRQSSATGLAEEPKAKAAVVAVGSYNGAAKACAALGGSQPAKAASLSPPPDDCYASVFTQPSNDRNSPASPAEQLHFVSLE